MKLNYRRIATILCTLFLVMVFMFPARAQFVRGADIGWLDQMEVTGYKFYSDNGVQQNCLQILRDHGINTVRLRVWVNPSNHKINGHCSRNEVVKMALRAQEMGMRVMIDFHYSDSWADPGKQNKPAAWAGHSFNDLLTDVYDHTYEVLDTLKKSGVIPAWVQIGNEITWGMLWPDGSTDNWPQLAQLLNMGYDAAKAVDPSIKVIVHIDQGHDNYRCRTFYDNAEAQGVRYDIIGLSYYPYWQGSDYRVTINMLGNNLKNMAARYGKEVMVVEVGGDFALAQNTYDMLVAVMVKVQAVPDKMGLGVIYWEPEGEKSWSGYQLSCWGAGGKPTIALDAFLWHDTGIDPLQKPREAVIYPNPCQGSLHIKFNIPEYPCDIRIFNLEGRMVNKLQINGPSCSPVKLDLMPGIYLVKIDNGTRTVIEKLVLNR
jgi:arabinogalactan endo-1,4-beta-galactosidase